MSAVGCLPGGGVCPKRCVCQGVSAGGFLPGGFCQGGLPRGSAQGGVCPGRCLSGGGVCWGVSAPVHAAIHTPLP